MAYRTKNYFWKRFATLFLVVSIVSSTAYLPVFTPRAQALFGVFDFGFDLEDVVKFALDAVAVPIAQRMVDDIVKETITWANTGFEGGPAYVTDPGQHFINTADAVAGKFIEGNDLGFLCSPFQANIRLSLARQYYQPVQERFQCTLSEVSGNIEGFFDGDFNGGGGWDAWFAATQNPTNNPYGAYLEAKVELDSRIAERIGLAENEFLVNQGFLSFKECAAFNPDQSVIDAYESGEYRRRTGATPEENEAFLRAQSIAQGNTPYDPTKPAGACIQDGPVKTAGATIKSQLDRVLPSGLERLINADQMSELVGAFASGLLQRYVFGSKGLFASDTAGSSSREVVDVDDDGIPDGYDLDQDGQLDICHHGIKQNLPPGTGANNENCQLSSTVQTSPFFIPLCEKLSSTNRELERYLEFIERNPFQKEHASTWLNRSIIASGQIEELVQAISRLEAQEYDRVVFEIGKYTSRLDDKIIVSLSKDKDLKGPRSSDEDHRQLIIKDTREILRYLRDFESSIGSCSNPNPDGIDDIETTTIDPLNEDPDGGTPEPPRENPETETEQ